MAPPTEGRIFPEIEGFLQCVQDEGDVRPCEGFCALPGNADSEMEPPDRKFQLQKWGIGSDGRVTLV